MAAAAAAAGVEEDEEVEEVEEAQLAGGGSTAGASASASVSASGTDTDSEYCSDPVQLPGPAVSGSSGGCSSRSAPVLAVKASAAAVAPDVEVVESCGSCSKSGGVALPSKKMKVARERDGGGGGCGRQGIRKGMEEEQPKTKKRRNVVTLRLARSKMPSRWAAPPPPFETCLNDVRPEDRLGGGFGGGGGGAWGGGDDAGAAAAAASMLGLWEGDVVDAKNWLSSGFIDVVMAKFARTYPDVHFMPIDFAVLCLNGWGVAEAAPRPRYAPSSSSASCSSSSSSSSLSPSSTSSSLSSSCSAVDRHGGAGDAGGGASAVAGASATAAVLADEGMTFRDILGRPIVYSERRPVIFLTHVNNVHWNLLRVEHDPVPELQLFEPMGKPPRRQGGSRAQSGAAGSSGSSGGASSSSSRGTGFRCIPKEVYRWLDAVWPLGAGEPRNPGRASSPRGGGGGAWGGGGVGAGGGGGGGSGTGKKRKASSKKGASDGGWAFRAYSAITRQQQTTGFDCGVAALLYAEKCGQGQMREDVDAWTTQRDMTEYRRSLQRYVQEVLRCQSPSSSSAPSSSSSSEAAAVTATAEADAAAVAAAAAAVRVTAAAAAAAEVSAAAAAAEAAAAAAGLALAAAAAAVESSSPFFSSTPSLFSSASSPLSPSPLLPEACLGAAVVPLASNPLHNPPSQGGSSPPPPPLPPPPPPALVPLLPTLPPPSLFDERGAP